MISAWKNVIKSTVFFLLQEMTTCNKEEKYKPSIAIIAEQQLVIIIGSAANWTIFTFDTLPSIALHWYYHVWCELKAWWMAGAPTVWARYQVFGNICFAIFASISQTKIAIRRWWCFISWIVWFANNTKTFIIIILIAISSLVWLNIIIFRHICFQISKRTFFQWLLQLDFFQEE